MRHCAFGFGLVWRSDIALPAFDPLPGRPDGDSWDEVRVGEIAELRQRNAAQNVGRGHVYSDGIRFPWRDEAIFDMFDGVRIDYRPGPAWRGAMPSAFYSTIVALTLAWRGALPLHACAVEIGGRAILIAGPSGAGKSSLTAGLLRLGARFVADDLAVARSGPDGIEILRGRPGMRQHKDGAAGIAAPPPEPVADDPRGKWLIRPSARASEPALKLAGMLALTGSGPLTGADGTLSFVVAQMFRPRWLASLPNHVMRRRQLLELAGAVPIADFPALRQFDPLAETGRAARAMALIEKMIGA